jgi:hypothetical protein
MFQPDGSSLKGDYSGSARVPSLEGVQNIGMFKTSRVKKISAFVSINLKSCSLAICTEVVIQSLYRLYVNVFCRGPPVWYATFVFVQAVVLYAPCFSYWFKKCLL